MHEDDDDDLFITATAASAVAVIVTRRRRHSNVAGCCGPGDGYLPEITMLIEADTGRRNRIS